MVEECDAVVKNLEEMYHTTAWHSKRSSLSSFSISLLIFFNNKHSLV